MIYFLLIICIVYIVDEVASQIGSQMQSIYIQECAPAKHRATIYSAIKAIATLGIFIVPLLRSIFIPGDDLSGWKHDFVSFA